MTDPAPYPDAIAALEKHLPFLTQTLPPLADRVDAEAEFALSDWLMIGGLALEWNPRLIIEGGRGSCGTTCLFLALQGRLEGGILSFDDHGARWSSVGTRVRDHLPPGALDRLMLVDTSPVGFRFDRHIPPSPEPVLVVLSLLDERWMTSVLQTLFPLLAGRPTLVIARGISDLRGGLIAPNPAYRTFGTFQSKSSHAAALHDWLLGHQIPVRSPSLDSVLKMQGDARLWTALRRALPRRADPLIGVGGHWIYFRLASS